VSPGNGLRWECGFIVSQGRACWGVRSQVWEDLVVGAGWVLWWCGRQVPELAWVERAVRGGLWGPLKDGLKMWLECLRKVVERHPALTSVHVTCRDECVLVELVCHGGEHWVGVCDAGWASGGACGGLQTASPESA
jgi:hypothetical protein